MRWCVGALSYPSHTSGGPKVLSGFEGRVLLFGGPMVATYLSAGGAESL
jgi:hypothetical protein